MCLTLWKQQVSGIHQVSTQTPCFNFLQKIKLVRSNVRSSPYFRFSEQTHPIFLGQTNRNRFLPHSMHYSKGEEMLRLQMGSRVLWDPQYRAVLATSTSTSTGQCTALAHPVLQSGVLLAGLEGDSRWPWRDVSWDGLHSEPRAKPCAVRAVLSHCEPHIFLTGGMAPLQARELSWR